MKRWEWLAVVLAIAMMAGCGVETASTAATAAAVKKREIEEGKKTEEMVRQKIDEAMQQAQRRNDLADDGAARY